MRTSVERNTEGLNWNAKVFGNDFAGIESFLEEYPKYNKPRVIPDVSPSEIVVNELEQWFEKMKGLERFQNGGIYGKG